MKHSAYIFEDINYFFTSSQIIDIEIGRAQKQSSQCILSYLEQKQNQLNFNHLACLLASFFQPNQQNILIINLAQIQYFVNSDGLKLIVNALNNILTKMQSKQNLTIHNEMVLKTILNIFYLTIDYLESQNIANPQSSRQLNQFYIDTQIDDLLMKMITLTLQAHYIPIKKLTMLYTKVLANIFHFQTSSCHSKNITPTLIYTDESINKIPKDNLLKYGMLQQYKKNNPPSLARQYNRSQSSSIEHFYRKHNVGDCPLAQSIVVGLLRSLLTICNCQTHKKFQTVKGSGVDSFRQWQLSYRYALDNFQQLQKHFSASTIKLIQQYEQFDKNASKPQAYQSRIYSDFYSHKIYSTSAITSFFMLIILALKQNMFIQYSYFLQLISDANGILVFLKFLTDKFQKLEQIKSHFIFTKLSAQNPAFQFKQQAMLTIYAVLSMLYSSCANYPQKIRNYLFQYNSYLIIKKIPTLFFDLPKKDAEPKQSQDAQTNPQYLPSKEEIDHIEQLNKSSISLPILRKLTELCFDLLKIQIPFFSKKMKQNAANMKMIIDIYCKYPKATQPIKLSSLQKILLKNKSKLLKQDKYITNIEEMKTIHNQYNNLYYWGNDFLQESKLQIKSTQNLDNIIDAQQWLEQNVWKYYD